ncbi:amino acid adenylation domain-containing protein [Paenibacillus athensensis]|nr:non-ribosomal peptide synthetase [Paenibacillus athensensis]MCD1260584.1 amino acid adenylation domain-containing protein [Paenibacillus athensensis]
MIKQSPGGSGQQRPLTYPQKRIWHIEQQYPGITLAGRTSSVIVKSALDFSLLEQAIRLTARRHEMLRLRLAFEGGEPVQFVSEEDDAELQVTDFSDCGEPRAEFDRWMQQQAERALRLNGGPLCEFRRFRISRTEAGFLIKLHPMVADARSMDQIAAEICSVYAALVRGETPDAAPAPSYLHDADDEHEYMESERYARSRRYWNDKYRGVPEELLSCQAREKIGMRRMYRIDSRLSQALQAWASERQSSLHAVVMLLYALYAGKTSGQTEVAIGTPVGNRSGAGTKGSVGLFTNLLPLRCALDPRESVSAALDRLQEELAECYFHQRYPLELLMQDLELERKGFDHLFDVCVSFGPAIELDEVNGAAVEYMDGYSGSQMYGLQLAFREEPGNGGLSLYIDYQTSLYNQAQIDDLFERLLHVGLQMVERPNASLAELSLLTAEERRWQLEQFNATRSDYPRHSSIDRLFEEQAERTPERTALSFQGTELTYRELNERANQLARLLQRQGVGRESFVGVLTRHSLETVVAIMAVIKSGGTYLPLEPTYPEERIRYMLDDSGCSLLLTNLAPSELPVFAGQVVQLTDPAIYSGPADNLGVLHSPGDLVYIIYTSGSTGKPKGAMIEHRGLVNYIWWAKLMYVKEEREVFPLYSSLAFDLTVTSIFTPLISGGTIRVYRDDEDEYVLYRIMRDNEATVVKLTPAHLALLKDTDYRHSSVRRFIVGGEDLRVSLAASIHECFGGRIEICNEYGPTETVVGCMIHIYDPQRDTKASVPIGIPAHNVQIYLLDSSLQPVPVQTIGEMYISGDGIARGYWNRSDLTTERFMDNPFVPGQRMYRTGDLARLLDSGVIEYAGRVDHQVKIRGYRIELGEIEKQISQLAAIKDVVVIDREHADGSGKYLCAYIVRHAEISAAELRSYLSERLPEYMVPAYVVELADIPLNANGKVNRAQLPEPAAGGAQSDAAFIAAATQQERLLTSVLGEVLHTAQVGLADNFYHLGGDSIKAIQAASKLKRAGYTLKVKHMLSNPVIEQMLAYLEPDQAAAADQGLCKGSVGVTPISAWFWSLDLPKPEHYNQSVLLHVADKQEPQMLAVILDALIMQHDSLRLRVDRESRTLRYNEHPAASTVMLYDLSALPEAERLAELNRRGEQLKASLNLQQGPLLKACLFDLGADGQRLLLTAHHLVTDGLSWRIMLEDLEELMTAQAEGKPFSLPAKTNSYQLWADYVQQHSEAALKEYPYWSAVLNGELPLPIGGEIDSAVKSVGNNSEAGGADRRAVVLSGQLSASTTTQLLTAAGVAYGTEPHELLTAALAAAVGETFGVSSAVIELEGHGREELGEPFDISRTVGWFTSIYPALLTALPSREPGEQLKTTKEQLRAIPRKGIGYGHLVYLTESLQADPQRRRIRFNYLGDFDASFGSNHFTLSAERSGAESSADNPLTALLDINAMIVGGQLRWELAYETLLVPDEAAQRLNEALHERIQAFIRHCCERDQVEFTPSDFETLAISQDELDGLLL